MSAVADARELRSYWADLTLKATRLAREARTDAPAHDPTLIQAARIDLRFVRADRFPIDAPVARRWAAAFLQLLEAFVEAGPEQRTACAEALAAAAQLVSDTLESARAAAADGWRQRFD